VALPLPAHWQGMAWLDIADTNGERLRSAGAIQRHHECRLPALDLDGPRRTPRRIGSVPAISRKLETD
jgi:hypothetical protein